MARYMVVYACNGNAMAYFVDSYAQLSELIDKAFKDGTGRVRVYALNRDNVYEYLLTIREYR